MIKNLNYSSVHCSFHNTIPSHILFLFAYIQSQIYFKEFIKSFFWRMILTPCIKTAFTQSGMDLYNNRRNSGETDNYLWRVVVLLSGCLYICWVSAFWENYNSLETSHWLHELLGRYHCINLNAAVVIRLFSLWQVSVFLVKYK